MSPTFDSQASLLTRESCYLIIAQKRCESSSADNITSLVRELLNTFLESYEKKHHLEITSDLKNGIHRVVGKDLQSYISNQYINDLCHVYTECLTNLSNQELNFVAQNPTAGMTYSEAHSKFHMLEKLGILPIKQRLIVNLVTTGKQLLTRSTYVSKICRMLSNSAFLPRS